MGYMLKSGLSKTAVYQETLHAGAYHAIKNMETTHKSEDNSYKDYGPLSGHKKSTDPAVTMSAKPVLSSAPSGARTPDK